MTAWRPPPTEAEHESRCPWWKYPSFAFSISAKWPMVDRTNFPFVQTSGVLKSIDVSKSDSAFIHYTYDLDMTMIPDPKDRWLVLNGGAELVLETETGGMMPGARPRAGDHVTVKGRWIFDCGHAAHTEIHPLYVVESDRLENHRMWKGGDLKRVRVANVWMNPAPGYGYAIRNLSNLGPFEFELRFPSTGTMPFLLIAEQDMNFVPYYEGCSGWAPTDSHITVKVSEATIRVRITPAGTSDWGYLPKFYRLVVGHVDQPSVTGPEHPGLLFPAADFWKPRLADESNDPKPFDLGELPLGGTLVTGKATPTDSIESGPGWCTRKHLSYLTEGTITSWVPAMGFSGSFCPFEHRFPAGDVDRYRFTTDDFADVTVGELPPDVVSTLEPTWPDYYVKSVPEDVRAKLGYLAGRIDVRSTTGQKGDVPYTLELRATRRDLPKAPEIVTALGPGASGLLVDLVTPRPGTSVEVEEPDDLLSIASRYLAWPWAWQQVAGEVHFYDVYVPRARTRPTDQAPCGWDQDGSLRIEARGMRLRIKNDSTGAIIEGDDSITIPGSPDLNARFPDGHVALEVVSSTGRRGVYRLETHWYDGRYYDPTTCTTLDRMEAIKNAFKKPELTRPIRSLADIVNWRPAPGPDPPAPWVTDLDLGPLGGAIPVIVAGVQDLAAVVSSPADTPVVARLYDADGLLLGESTAIDQVPDAVRLPGGTVPQAQLTVSGLEPNNAFFIQVVTTVDAAGVAGGSLRVGLTMLPSA